MRCAVSIYLPGDVAPVHLHAPNASRTILTDKGGYTNVEGERCEATRGDIILTPNGTWHDHGNESGQPVIWIDMLDWPLMEYLDCVWVDQNYIDVNRGNAKSQPAAHGDGYSTRMYGHGGLKPVFTSNQRGWGNTVQPPTASAKSDGATRLRRRLSRIFQRLMSGRRLRATPRRDGTTGSSQNRICQSPRTHRCWRRRRS